MKPSKLAFWALALICIASFSMMFYASRTESAIDDELAHIPAGYGYVHELDYRLNPEHPPLVKALAMLPVLFLNPAFPTTSTAWTSELNGQWDMGKQFLYESGNDANVIIQTARIVPIFITILTILLIYFLARKLMGNWWALLPATLFGFSPTILAHGHYVTTDVGAAFGATLATYFFLAFLETPTTKRLWLAGLAFGIAQVTKFSTPLLLPLFLFVILMIWIRSMIITWKTANHSYRFKNFALTGLRYFRNLILIVAIGYVFIVYPIYFLFTAHYPIAKQVSDTQTILTSFATGPTPAGQFCKGIRCLADADIWMAKNPVTRPYAEYLLGILMVLQRADGGNTIYFLGHVVVSGGWIYFPVLYLLKEPIPSLIVVLFALIFSLWMAFKRLKRAHFRPLRPVLDYIGLSLPEFTMGSFIVLYWGYSMHSLLNIGIRHIIPTLPFVYILAAGVWKKWIVKMRVSPMTNASGIITLNSVMASAGMMMRSFFVATFKYILLVVLIIWLFLEALFVAPHFLSYFNEFAGGTANGYRYVVDSNYDWGQDLLLLQTWLKTHPEVDKIAVHYFGGGDAKYYLGSKEIDWQSSKGNPADQNIHWFAVSVDALQGAIEPLGPGQNRNASDTYSWLVELRPPQPGMGNVPPPDYRIGTSIFVYHL
jgi:hypothetical protein